MKITLGRAAAWFEWRANNTPMAGARTMFEMAGAALREKSEREAPLPLTLEELRQMDGEPVWIDDWWEDSHGWELSMDASDYFEGERRTEKEYGSIWVAYRHKPKEG